MSGFRLVDEHEPPAPVVPPRPPAMDEPWWAAWLAPGFLVLLLVAILVDRWSR